MPNVAADMQMSFHSRRDSSTNLDKDSRGFDERFSSLSVCCLSREFSLLLDEKGRKEATDDARILVCCELALMAPILDDKYRYWNLFAARIDNIVA